MARYAAMLRGVMPFNCKMPALKAAFEAAGFDDVRTVLGSGNVVFAARAASEAALKKKAEAAMAKHLGRSFLTIVRPVEMLRELLESDPWPRFRLPAGAKRNVTFLLDEPATAIKLPCRIDGAAILAIAGREVFSYYTRGRPTVGPEFMAMLEKNLGKAVTTRTWETVMKLAR